MSDFHGKRCDRCAVIYEVGPGNWETRIVRGVLEVAPHGLFEQLPKPTEVVQARHICSAECATREAQEFVKFKESEARGV